MDLSPPRGTQDLLPPRSERLQGVYDAAHRVAHRYGYRYVETPTFEGTELFARTSGETSDVVNKEMYTFQDRGGRSLTLRPEGTAPVVRAVLAAPAEELYRPYKLYYVETLFRYGRPQKGRLREFRSFGIEVLNEPSPEADVEVIAVGAAFLRELGIERWELQLNTIGDQVCRPAYRALLLAYLEGREQELQDEHRTRFRENPMRVLDCKDDACRAVAADAPRIADHLCDPCREHFAAVRDGLSEEAIAYALTPTLVRGLDYYTRTAFEFVAATLSASQGTVIGGGRYDGLAEVIGGRAIAGVGFGAGVERSLLAAEAEGPTVWSGGGPAVVVVAMDRVHGAAARTVLRDLRRHGVGASTSFGWRRSSSQLSAAERAGARFAILIGDREVSSGTLTVKRLSDAEQRELSLDEAVAWVREGR